MADNSNGIENIGHNLLIPVRVSDERPISTL